MWKGFFASLNFAKQCRQYNIGIWQCPQFLFILMGGITILGIVASFFTAAFYGAEPELVALIASLAAAGLFSIGHIIVSSFERIAASSRDKSEFISIMSHQLRSPLSSIKWILNSFSRDLPLAETSSIIEATEEQNEKMIQLVNDLIDVNKIEDKALFLRPNEFSLVELIHKVVREYQRFADSSNVVLKVLIDSAVPLVLADENRLKSVLRHLIDNAVRYSAKDSALGGAVEVKLERTDGFAKCSVSDQGIGIEKKDQKNIFKKFFRSQSALRYQTEGTGVGLYLVKNIIGLSGGKTGFESEINKGSTFWFTLPIKK